MTLSRRLLLCAVFALVLLMLGSPGVAGESWIEYNSDERDAATSIAISPDGSTVAVGVAGGDIYIIETQTGDVVESISPGETPGDIDWSPDGHRIAIGEGSFDSDGRVWIYNVTTGDIEETLTEHSNSFRAVEWSPNGSWLATGGDDETVEVYNAETFASVTTINLDNNILSLDWATDESRLAIGRTPSNGGLAKVYNTTDWSEELQTSASLRAEGVALLNNGSYLVVAEGFTGGGEIALWDVDSGQKIDTIRDGEEWVSAASTDDRVAVGRGDDSRTVRVYEVVNGNLSEVDSYTPIGQPNDEVGDMAWSADGNFISAVTMTSSGGGWHVATDKPVIDGTVTDQDGNPVSETEIQIADPGGDFFIQNFSTQSDGEYRLVVEEPGEYDLIGYKATDSEFLFDIKRIEVPSDGITVPFTVETFDIGVFGQVVDDMTGLGIANATVEMDGTSIQTTPNGEFVIGVDSAGEYDISASASGYFPEIDRTLSVPEDGLDDVIIGLEKIVGVLVQGTVENPDGDPIDGATVEADGTQASTGSNGQYFLEITSGPGNYSITASTAVDSDSRVENVPSDGLENVDFVLDEPADGVDPSGNLEIRSEQTGELINDRNVTVEFFGDDDASELSTTTGIIDLDILSHDETVVAQGDADGFENRRIIIDDTGDDHRLFLLDATEVGDDRILVTEFLVSDVTGRFMGDDTRLYIERSMPLPGESLNIPYRVLASDFVDADDRFGILLEADQRHRLWVKNDRGDVQELGDYTSTREQTVELTIGELEWELDNDIDDLSWDASRVNESGVESIRFQLSDPAPLNESAENLHVRMFETGNESHEIYNATHDGPLGNVSILQPIPDANVTGWTVEWTATRHGEEIGGQVILGPGRYGIPLDSDWIHIFSAILITFVAGMFSVRVSLMGAIIVPGVALGLWAMGWLPLPLIWILGAATIGVGAEFANRGGFSQHP